MSVDRESGIWRICDGSNLYIVEDNVIKIGYMLKENVLCMVLLNVLEDVPKDLSE